MVPLGLDGMRQHLAEVKKTYPDYTMNIIKQYADGDYVISEFIMQGTHKGEFIGIKPTIRNSLLQGLILIKYCLKAYTDKKKMAIPNKIDLLNRLGIIAPRILRKINKVRNTMEHDFYCPGIDEVQDFADVILLFISYTDKYLFETKKECELIDDESQFYCIPEFDRDEQKIIVDVRGSLQGTQTITFEAGNENLELFIEFLRLYINLIC